MVGPRILRVRGIQVLVDADLAEIYGVSTKALNQAVKRIRRAIPGGLSVPTDGGGAGGGGHEL
jgi:stage V sporulation protein SpoVS